MTKRPANIANVEELDWVEGGNGKEHEFKRKSFTQVTGAQELGCSFLRLPAGKKSFPLHHHYGNEEAIYILKGEGTLVYGDEKIIVGAGDYIALPRGTEKAHQMHNTSDADLDYLCMSTMKEPEVVIYPESEKMGVFAGAMPGVEGREMTLRRIIKAEDVPYWDED